MKSSFLQKSVFSFFFSVSVHGMGEMKVPEGDYIAIGSCSQDAYTGGVMPFVHFEKVTVENHSSKCPDSDSCNNGVTVYYDISSYDDHVHPDGERTPLSKGCACVQAKDSHDEKNAMTYFSINDLSHSGGTYPVVNISSGRYNPKYNVLEMSTIPWADVRLAAYDPEKKDKPWIPDSPYVHVLPYRGAKHLLGYIARLSSNGKGYCNDFDFTILVGSKHGKYGLVFPGDEIYVHAKSEESKYHCKTTKVVDKHTNNQTVEVYGGMSVGGYQFSPWCKAWGAEKPH